MGPATRAATESSSESKVDESSHRDVIDSRRLRLPEYVPFDPANFVNWKLKMEGLFRYQKVLTIVQGTETADGLSPGSPTLRSFEDRKSAAYTAILMSMSNATMKFIRTAPSGDAAAAWQGIISHFECNTHSNRLALRDQFQSRRMRPGESVLDFIDALEVVVHQLESLGSPVCEDDKMTYLLRGVPSSYHTIVSICRNLPSPTYADCVRRIVDYSTDSSNNADLPPSQSRTDSARGSVKGSERGLAASTSGGRRQPSRPPAPGGSTGRTTRDKSRDTCNWCGGRGHWAPDCPQKKLGKPRSGAPLEKAAAASDKAPSSGSSGGGGAVGTWTCDANFAEVTTALSARVSAGAAPDFWIVDSGASSHMSGTRSLFSELVPPPTAVIVRLADSHAVPAEGVGVVGPLRDVLFVPGLTANLISVSKLVSSGFSVVFEGSECRIITTATGAVIASGRQSSGIYKLKFVLGTSQPPSAAAASAIVASPHQPVATVPPVVVNPSGDVPDSSSYLASATVPDAVSRWHQRLGHVSVSSVRRLVEHQMVGSLSDLPAPSLIPDAFCPDCVVGKSHRQPFPHASHHRASAPLELVHSDVAGPMEVASLGGARYFVTFVDDFSRKMWVYFLRQKSEVLSRLQEFVADAGGRQRCCERTTVVNTPVPRFVSIACLCTPPTSSPPPILLSRMVWRSV